MADRWKKITVTVVNVEKTLKKRTTLRASHSVCEAGVGLLLAYVSIVSTYVLLNATECGFLGSGLHAATVRGADIFNTTCDGANHDEKADRRGDQLANQKRHLDNEQHQPRE